jgi:predicted Zn-dependent protease
MPMRAIYRIGTALALAGCAGLGVAQTARSISASDKASGAKAHPQLLEEFGGAYAGPQSAYVAQVGKRVAVQSGLSNSERDFTITLLNSPVNNAFAIPGGYVYVTRELLALMNDEAELASVLGHEVGHVAARHANKRNTTSTIGQVLAAGLGILTGNSQIGQIAGYGAQLYTLRFSRQQEYQADDLGIRYLKGSGYDPLAAADMLASLNAQSSLDARIAGKDANSLPTWASTHPNTAVRVTRARSKAQATGAVAGKGLRNRDAFLAALDGLIYEDDPKQGIVDGRSFKHPDLKIAFTVPQGFTIANGTQAVSVTGSGGQAQFSGGRIPSGGLGGYIDAVFRALSSGGVNYGDIRTTRVNGINAAYASARANSSAGQVDVTVFAYDMGGGSAYHFLTIARAGAGAVRIACPELRTAERCAGGGDQAAANRCRDGEIGRHAGQPGGPDGLFRLSTGTIPGAQWAGLEQRAQAGAEGEAGRLRLILKEIGRRNQVPPPGLSVDMKQPKLTSCYPTRC